MYAAETPPIAELIVLSQARVPAAKDLDEALFKRVASARIKRCDRSIISIQTCSVRFGFGSLLRCAVRSNEDYYFWIPDQVSNDIVLVDNMAVNQKDIEAGLQELGLEKGDIVVVHSSLSSFGRVEGGADAVIDAVLSVIGPEGTMLVPTFNYAPDPFDPETTPSLTGSITEAVRKRPEAIRSLHPTHSVTAIGRDAEEITAGHEKVDSFAIGSPLHKVLERNGKILQLGVTHTSNSTIHVAEELAEVPYLDRIRVVTILQPDKSTVRKTLRRPGCSKGFDKIEEYLDESGQVHETMIGESRVRLMPASVVVSTAVEMLSNDPASLLCDLPDCPTCAESHAFISAARIAWEDEMVRKAWEEEGKYVDPYEG